MPRKVTPTSRSPPSVSAFADPAILSFRAQPGRQSPETQNQPNSSSQQDREPSQAPSIRIKKESRENTPTQAPVELPDGQGVSPPESPKHEGAASSNTTQKKKRRQRQPRKNGPADESLDALPTDPSKGSVRGKGWRQTPILQSTSSFQPFNSLKRAGKGRPPAIHQNNGWASEDVTDVQEMGDFDFESSLAKFDKRTLFDEMRKQDQVDDAERLVSHNRQPRNLRHSENVLDIPPTAAATGPRDAQAVGHDFWNSEADDRIAAAGERLSGREHGSRQGSRRGESKVSSTRRSQSRKASAQAGPGQGAPIRVNSGVRAPPMQKRSAD